LAVEIENITYWLYDNEKAIMDVSWGLGANDIEALLDQGLCDGFDGMDEMQIQAAISHDMIVVNSFFARYEYALCYIG
jgi:hypothetical protein